MQSLCSVSIHSLPQTSLDSHTTQMLKKWHGYLHQLSFIWPSPHRLPLNCGYKATWWRYHSTANPVWEGAVTVSFTKEAPASQTLSAMPEQVSKWQNWALRDSSSDVDWASLIWNLKSKNIPNPKLSELQQDNEKVLDFESALWQKPVTLAHRSQTGRQSPKTVWATELDCCKIKSNHSYFRVI